MYIKNALSNKHEIGPSNSTTSRICVPFCIYGTGIFFLKRNMRAMRKSKGVLHEGTLLQKWIKRIMISADYDRCDMDYNISGRPTVNKLQMRTLENQKRGRDTVSDRSLMIVRRFVYLRSDWPRSPLTDRRKSRHHRLFEQVEHARVSEWTNERTNEADKCLLSLHTPVFEWMLQFDVVVVVVVLSSFMQNQLKRAWRQLRFNSLQ